MASMSPEQVIEHYGSQAKVAVALGISQPSIWEWVENGRVPLVRQYQIELATGGALRADKPADRSEAVASQPERPAA